MKKIIYKIIMILMFLNISLSVSSVKSSASFISNYKIENGALTVESDTSYRTADEDDREFGRTLMNFLRRYKNKLALASGISTLSGLLGVIILLIKLSSLGDNSWIVRRNIIIALGVCGVVTAILGSFTLFLMIFYDMFAVW